MSLKEIRVRTEQLIVGMTMKHAAHGLDDKVLMTAGSTVTESVRNGLLALGIQEIALHPADAEQLGILTEAGTSAEASTPTAAAEALQQAAQKVTSVQAHLAALAESVSLVAENTGPPVKDRVVARGREPYDSQQRQRVAKQFSQATSLLDSMVKVAQAGEVQDVQSLNATASELLTEVTDDSDNVLASSAEHALEPDVMERAVRLSLLGMAVAIEMGYDEPIVREIGLCGMLHDWGLCELPPELQVPRRALSGAESERFVQHPLLSVAMLASMDNLSDAVRVAVSQVHENADGSGYPRGLTNDQIHPFARVVHVAEVFLELNLKSHHRGAYRPYDTMAYLLRQAKAGRIDSTAMRALLNTMSLFPIGSRVRLSDGGEAQVLRRNGSNYMQPIVQRVGAMRKFRADNPQAAIIDLSQSDLRLIAPVASPERDEVPLESELMDTVLWGRPGAGA